MKSSTYVLSFVRERAARKGPENAGLYIVTGSREDLVNDDWVAQGARP